MVQDALAQVRSLDLVAHACISCDGGLDHLALSATIRCFSADVQRRREPVEITSSRVTDTGVCCLGGGFLQLGKLQLELLEQPRPRLAQSYAYVLNGPFSQRKADVTGRYVPSAPNRLPAHCLKRFRRRART